MIGPGRLLLVVGPSGAGKDTLLAGARALCADDEAVVFARRVVTRPSSAAEDHDTLDDAAFRAAIARDAFAFWWEAHGHCYGIPRAIDDDIRAGHTVVCNASRGVVANLHNAYQTIEVVLVTAAADVLAARLAMRGRASDASADERLARNEAYRDFAVDYMIDNSGSIERGVAQLVELIRRDGA